MTPKSYLVACAAAIVVAAPEGRVPARYRSGPLPQIPLHAVGGGEVILEVSVTRGGIVSEITAARSSPPFTDVMTAAVRGWRFQPAEDTVAVDSRVLVAAVFRPPDHQHANARLGCKRRHLSFARRAVSDEDRDSVVSASVTR